MMNRSSCSTIWLAVGALTALMAAPASAATDSNLEDSEPIFSGLIDVNVGFRRNDSSRVPTDNQGHFTYGGGGRVNIPLYQGLSAQFDLQSETYQLRSNETVTAEGAHMATGHLSWRNDKFLVGGFAGGGQAVSRGSDTAGFVAGGETQAYLGDVTLYAQAGYGDFKANNGAGFRQGWFTGLEGRYFFRENYGVRTGFTYGETGNYLSGGRNGAIFNYGAEIFGRVVQRYPIYATIAYVGGQYDSQSPADQGGDDRVLFGARFLFGTLSAKENDRRGATLSGPMHPARAASWAGSF